MPEMVEPARIARPSGPLSAWRIDYAIPSVGRYTVPTGAHMPEMVEPAREILVISRTPYKPNRAFSNRIVPALRTTGIRRRRVPQVHTWGTRRRRILVVHLVSLYGVHLVFVGIVHLVVGMRHLVFV